MIRGRKGKERDGMDGTGGGSDSHTLLVCWWTLFGSIPNTSSWSMAIKRTIVLLKRIWR